MSETCATCRYWQLTAPRRGGLPAAGLCRRYPPAPTTPAWPVIGSDAWCGEHHLGTAEEIRVAAMEAEG